MRIVITGATGFIGSNLARLCLERGDTVFALVRPGSAHLDQLPEHENLKPVFCEMDKMLDAATEIGQADAFFHFAWGGVNRQEIDSPEVQAKNISASLDAVRAAGKLGCKLFMDAGSRVEYGRVENRMQEDVPCNPINQYGKAKWEFYRKAAPLCRELKLGYYHLRFFSVYGYGDHPWSIISTLVRDLRQEKTVSLSACLHQWNFMYIDDAVEAVYALLETAVREKTCPDGVIVNVASRDTRRLRDFVEEIHHIVGNKGTLEYGTFVQAKEGALSIRPDVTRLEALTGGFKERYTFARGIEETIRKEEMNQKEAERK